MAYHHGRLRESLIDAAVTAIEQEGLARLSLRDLARRVGVSHAAPAHHFGDREGLLTAIAADGFERLASVLEEAGDDFLEVGVAYVRFATSERGRFEVMFRPDLHRRDDPGLTAAMDRAGDVLRSGAAAEPGDDRTNGLAAWSLVHGLATLWNAGAISIDEGTEVEVVARAVAGVLFGRTAGATGGASPADPVR
ncbi:TetR/AcrR family transcriptional regulator [Agromyces sp. H66]|uniref:TetR/AcrR family transcriptional regulator n=1 Tax=Agromyces sp. H66 TaxID=2529859 RepID=UPI0010AA883E|nr:TetR/AcrR family transcriptional regulator [Agromyces sp. H66]